ncbi:MAG: HNH endonuclease, partial [Tissierellia bacterium]|nr:HNH endonuclease [Tissierellia bacterium]
MKDVCQHITGKTTFTYSYVDNNYQDEFLESGYNKGRIAILQYMDEVSYITFSEKEIGGRNSSVQSVPTAFNMYYMNPYPKKKLYYYFLNLTGNAGTDYQMLMYR